MATVALELSDERSPSLPGGGLLGMPDTIANASGISSDDIARPNVITALLEIPATVLEARVASLCEFAASVPESLMRQDLVASQQAEKERQEAIPWRKAIDRRTQV